jgi:hypothetical protein
MLTKLALASALSLACFLSLPTLAHDPDGIYRNLPQATRDWFHNLRANGGSLCCDMADGHPTEWKADEKSGAYQVHIEGKWIDVPPESVIYHQGNPTDTAWVWYYPINSDSGTTYNIRCFVPGDGI